MDSEVDVETKIWRPKIWDQTRNMTRPEDQDTIQTGQRSIRRLNIHLAMVVGQRPESSCKSDNGWVTCRLILEQEDEHGTSMTEQRIFIEPEGLEEKKRDTRWTKRKNLERRKKRAAGKGQGAAHAR